MIIKKIDDVPMQDVNMEGAKDVRVRVILGPDDGVPTFAMRVFELAPSGHTPFHTHSFEHEVIVMNGDIAVVTEAGDKPLDKGDVLLIMPGDKHQFKNLSNTQDARFMCLVPIEYQK